MSLKRAFSSPFPTRKSSGQHHHTDPLDSSVHVSHGSGEYNSRTCSTPREKSQLPHLPTYPSQTSLDKPFSRSFNAWSRCEGPSFGRQIFELCETLPCPVGVRTRRAMQIVVLNCQCTGRLSSTRTMERSLHVSVVPGAPARGGLKRPQGGVRQEGGPVLSLARPK